MGHVNRVMNLWVLAALLAGGCQALAQSGSQQATKKPGGEAARAAEPSDSELNTRAYIELLRSDVKARATAVVGEVMQLSDNDAAKFWPIYREFEAELAKIGDGKIALIKKYVDNYENITDTLADEIVQGAFKLELDRNTLKMKYYERMKTALSARTAARFVQVENQILMLVDLQIAAALPVAK